MARSLWQLRNLFADPAMRRQGIARRLVETIQHAASDAELQHRQIAVCTLGAPQEERHTVRTAVLLAAM